MLLLLECNESAMLFTIYTVGYAVLMNQRHLHIGLADTNSVQNYLPINYVTGPTKQQYNAYIVMHGQIVVQSLAREGTLCESFRSSSSDWRAVV